VSIVTQGADGFWRIEVADSGEGIPPDKLGSVFEPFFSTRATGTGLGLAFTRQVVKAHGGSVRAHNAASRGAVFTVEIPTLRTDPHEQTAEQYDVAG
jgi:signal transduction histidine kinase